MIAPAAGGDSVPNEAGWTPRQAIALVLGVFLIEIASNLVAPLVLPPAADAGPAAETLESRSRWARALLESDEPAARVAAARSASLLWTMAVRLAWVVWIVACHRVVQRRPLAELGLRAPPIHTTAATATLACAILGTMAFAAQAIGRPAWDVDLFRAAIADPETAACLDYPTAVAIHVGVVVAAGPAVEELFYRGVLYGLLRTRFGFPAAVGWSAALFALAHVGDGNVFPIVQFAGGIAFAWSYERTRSLAAPYLIHVAGNAFVLGVNVWAAGRPAGL